MFLPHLQTFRKLIPEHISRVFFGDLQFDVKMHEVFQDDALSLSTSAVYAFMQSPSNIHQKFSPQFVHLPVLLNKYSASGGTTRTGKLFAGPARRVTGSRNFLAGTRPQGRLTVGERRLTIEGEATDVPYVEWKGTSKIDAERVIGAFATRDRADKLDASSDSGSGLCHTHRPPSFPIQRPA